MSSFGFHTTRFAAAVVPPNRSQVVLSVGLRFAEVRNLKSGLIGRSGERRELGVRCKATALRIESTQESLSTQRGCHPWTNPLSTCDCKVDCIDSTRSRIRKLKAIRPSWRCAEASDNRALSNCEYDDEPVSTARSGRRPSKVENLVVPHITRRHFKRPLISIAELSLRCRIIHRLGSGIQMNISKNRNRCRIGRRGADANGIPGNHFDHIPRAVGQARDGACGRCDWRAWLIPRP